jgi:hypothetical protein
VSDSHAERRAERLAKLIDDVERSEHDLRRRTTPTAIPRTGKRRFADGCHTRGERLGKCGPPLPTLGTARRKPPLSLDSLAHVGDPISRMGRDGDIKHIEGESYRLRESQLAATSRSHSRREKKAPAVT